MLYVVLITACILILIMLLLEKYLCKLITYRFVGMHRCMNVLNTRIGKPLKIIRIIDGHVKLLSHNPKFNFITLIPEIVK